MAKSYEVKVYSKTGAYLTTWRDVVSEITFSNEMNTAGGQLSLKLARNAGDYGEGTDVDFGYRVKVYVFDKEEPNGKVIFQGYISAYTPIYKDNRVEITVLSFGAELNDYIIEAGESLDQSQLTNTTSFQFGNAGSPSNTIDLAQTFTATSSGKWNRIECYLKTVDYYNNATGQFIERTNIGCKVKVYAGSNPASLGALIGTSNTFYVLGRTEALASFTFTPAITIVNGQTYTFIFQPIDYAVGSDQYMLSMRSGAGYTGGQIWTQAV
jgi:hypothetical protein